MIPLVKICGLKTPETMEAALDAGADMVGLVFFPRSPRNIALASAAALARRARGRAAIVALIVEADDEAIEAIVDSVAPDWLQLHGQETVERAAAIRRGFGRPVMKAVAIASPADIDLARLHAPGVDRLLLDAKPPADAVLPGGNGLPFDWRLVAGLDLEKPFMLSGGLTAQNVAEAVRIARAAPAFVGVDVSSGVEIAPGVKDADRIAAFIAAVRQAGEADRKDRVA